MIDKLPPYWKFSELSEEIKNLYLLEIQKFIKFIEDTFDIEVFLTHGTLLGAIRNGDFIDNDSDIDLAILCHSENKESVIKETEFIYKKLIENKICGNFCKIGQVHTYASTFGKEKRLILDVWSAWIENGKLWSFPFIDGSLSSSTLLPFKKSALRWAEFNIPNDWEKYLEKTYYNWKKPDKNKGTTGWKFVLKKVPYKHW